MTEIRKAKYLRGPGATISRSTPCTFVVSVGRYSPDLDALCAGWDWTQSAFDRCAILVGDSLQRLTIEATEAKAPLIAREDAMGRASRLIERLVTARPEAPVIRTSDIANGPEFARWRVVMDRALNCMPAFRTILEHDAWAFCERQRRQSRLATSFNAALSLAVRYLVEEVAIYAVLAEDGWLAETYLGNELNILAAFMRGEFPGLAPALESRTHVSLRISNLRRAA
jgi:tRNA-dependent cyclodipeptide synthase